ncbi:ribonuclease H-like domain-containing protein [Christensenellaceae bacterium NSJ-44]|uniref:Ribonuclease H-like domain-containing protein n=1 Tax=Luoshenia tenuis TaxID=2763654 RepID=A0A926HLT8_9FIRM|nr:ribonuclease H-like domain-containing protein [Luoshenia tenuis]MBC8528438.1 ribonuclease H-like domain-containing protein [Luoshenia tenuis]
MISNLRAKLKLMAKEQGQPLRDETVIPPDTLSARAQEQAGLRHEVARYPLEFKRGRCAVGGFLRADPGAAALLGGPQASFDPRRALFIDTETTGLQGSGALAFLVGLGYFEGDEFVVQQFLMRDLCYEVDLLTACGQLWMEFDTLVTFNGRAFDWPLLRSRLIMNRLRQYDKAFYQMDLLYPARRVWSLRLQSCRLVALERDILGEERQGDIDGAEIPGRYYRYLRTGEEGLLSDIVLHNRLDVATMPALAGELCRLLRNPETAGHVQDIKSLGRIYHRQGELALAEKLYSLSGAIACRELGLLYKKEGRLDEAAAVWVQMVQKGLGGVFPHVELAKYAEHTLKDYGAACDWTQKALRFPLLSQGTQAELRHRLHRLQGKLAREREQKEEAT